MAVQHDYTELRYSLRSVEKHLPNMEVAIVGSRLPEWITNITHINLPDIPGRKQLSIRRKILAGLEYSGEIFFINDDHFLLKQADPKNYPYYYSGYLPTGETGGKLLMEQLKAQGRPIKHFDMHTPIRYERSKFKELEVFGGDCIIKSMYCNYHEIEGEEMPDLKINKKTDENLIREKLKNVKVFSTGPAGLQSCLPILEELYPTKSRFEL